MTFAFVQPSLSLRKAHLHQSSRTWTCSLTAPPAAAKAAKASSLLAPGQSHFLHVDDLSPAELKRILQSAKKIKDADLLNDADYRPLLNKAMSMVFAKPSSRTRVSFETAMFKLGGHALALGPEVGVNTREAAGDVARVLSGMTDVIMARLFAHGDLVQLAERASVPVINGLTDYNHPCQIVADALTMAETRGALEGAKVVYVGDGNNIVHSWVELAAVAPIEFVCCCPEGYAPDMGLVERARRRGARVSVSHDVGEATRGADFLYADVWASMGQKEELAERERRFQGFQVTDQMVKGTGVETRFLHCLPAERGREVTDEVMEAGYSEVFRQAENRMHAQVAIVLHCMGVGLEV
ncbi:unnamed protein product [Chondrus crispus]|uniref:ornithine carbamoyltransferase n=1 Tax=Chondrus crispus TaxID=2769 RepID=R7QGE7_CHOCR|nr:unnamed protein product [Chondrus crispus]CDF37164.1 unnamed protein product [Chondrus crispus]|eukprot:XP_005716983.1 unnamed protein product [Chondrus crispus]